MTDVKDTYGNEAVYIYQPNVRRNSTSYSDVVVPGSVGDRGTRRQGDLYVYGKYVQTLVS